MLLLQFVVRPLEEELKFKSKEGFSPGSLDEQAEKHDLALECHPPNPKLWMHIPTSVPDPTNIHPGPLLRSRGRR